MAATIDRLPSIYLPHGGGPWHVMDDFGGFSWDGLAAYLKGLGSAYAGRAKAILMVSAHWEERVATLHFGAAPGMYYDYYGFPEETYSIAYPAPGSPAIAQRAEELLKAAGITCAREEKRGYDHGAFVPLMVAFPSAAIPVVQLSLIAGLDPGAHLALGAALAPLRDEGVLILASGMSYHNMAGFGSADPRFAAEARRFDDWLARTVQERDPARRDAALAAWRTAPSAQACHPRSEHLVPLFVAAGAGAGYPARREYSESLMGVAVSGFSFGA